MPIAQQDDTSFGDRLEQAGAWRAELALAGVAASPTFEAWLNADPRNAQAWEESRASWELFDTRRSDPRLAAASQAAKDWARADKALRRRLVWSGLRWAATVVLLISVVVGTALYRPTQTFETAAGARRDVQLADGSSVSLDADTLLKVRFHGDRRDLELVRGQAVFDVAHDARRPFAVTAGDRRVIALGTRFNVDLLAGTAKITLMEGRVRVENLGRSFAKAASHAPTAAVSLQPGQQLVASADAGMPASTARVAEVDISKALAWRAGQLIFEDEPLADVAARVSRYSDTKVEVPDPGLARRRISGMFIAGDMATFLGAIEQHLTVEAVEVSPGRVELRRKNA